MSDDIVGVILAAGNGTRIQPFSATRPKPILPVGNRPLLETQLDLLRDHGIRDVTIVIGHLGHAIVDALGDGARLGVDLHYVEQRDTLGLAHAVGALESSINGPFLLLLGDIYLVADDLAPLLDDVRSERAQGVLASRVEPDPDMVRRNFAILAEDDGRVRRVIEKPRHVATNLKGCGLYVFDLPVFDAVRRTPRTAMRDEYEITDTIQIMIDDGHVIRHHAVVTEDVNLTVPEDLLRINLVDLAHRGLDDLVADDARLAPGTVVENSVIGPGAVVEQAITIRDSVVFAGSRITGSDDLQHVVVHSDGILQC